MTVLPDNNSEEILDVLDSQGTVVGTATREEVHAKGLWHRTFHCLIVRPDDSDSPIQVVLQRRSWQSRSFPGLIDLTASGHLIAGEAPRMGVRELAEETGLHVAPDRLIPLGVQLIVDERPGRLNREHVHVFLLVEDCPLGDFTPNPEEVESLVEIASEDLLELCHRQRLNDIEFAAAARQLGATDRELSDVELTINDLIPGGYNYFAKVVIMAERHVRGQHPVAV